MKRIRIYILLSLLSVSSLLLAQSERLKVELSSSASVSSNSELNPLWSYSNLWGIYSQYEQAELVVHGKARYDLLDKEVVDLQVGLGVVGSTNFDHSMIHEAYLKGRFYMIDLTVGMEAFSPLAKYDDLTSGNYLMSSNARPTPRIGLGIFDWWSIPYARDWLQIKGGCYLGMLFDEDNPKYTKDVILHEKFAYGRLGGWYVKPYLGLVHSVMMGGTSPTGEDIPIDFWASFLGKRSEKFRDISSMRGEATNAAGGHQGLWDMGLDVDFVENKMHFYYQRMFKDNGGTKPFGTLNKDHIMGIHVSFNDSKWLSAISLEWMRTSDQLGDGTPDPIGYDKNGNLIAVYPGDVPLDDNGFWKWINSHFTQADIEAWENETGWILNQWCYLKFLREHWDNGPHGGRKNYLNNGLYYQGWSAGGLSIGTPLFHSYTTQVKYMNGEGKTPNYAFFTNNRVDAITVGLSGGDGNRLSYRLKYTFSKNHGSLCEKYEGGAFGLHRFEDYFYTTSKKEHYIVINADYKLSESLSINAMLSADWGELYNAVALRIGAKYNIRVKR